MALDAIVWLSSTPFWVPGILAVGLFVWSWPRARDFVQGKPARKFGGYMTPKEVIDYMAHESKWGDRTSRFSRPVVVGDTTYVEVKNPVLDAFQEFTEQAKLKDTLIVSVGLQQGTGVPVPIAPTFWLANGLSVTAVLQGENRTVATAPGDLVSGTHKPGSRPHYTDIQVERDGVIATWPRMGFWERGRARKSKAGGDADLLNRIGKSDAELSSAPPADLGGSDRFSFQRSAAIFYDGASPRLKRIIAGLNPDDILGYCKHAILDSAVEKGFPVFGRRTAHTAHEEIPADTLSQLWPRNESDLGQLGAASSVPLWTDVEISESDVLAARKRYEED